MDGHKILVVDDDPDFLALIKRVLNLEGAQVTTAANGQLGLELIQKDQPHLVLLDIMMPGMDGWQVYERIREISQVPVVFLSVLSEEEHEVRGLDLGAHDYIRKTAKRSVLLARVQKALRLVQRAEEDDGETTEPTPSGDDLSIDLDRRLVRRAGRVISLTRTEFKVLAILARNEGKVLPYRQILEAVWGWQHWDDVQYVHVYVARLRNKLEPDPKNPVHILNQYGVGYRFVG